MSVLEVRSVTKRFPHMAHPAVDSVSCSVATGRCLGIVGGSGSGKSTLARMILLLEKPDEGGVFFDGSCISTVSPRQRKDVYRHIQMVFQNPMESFDLRYSLGASIAEFGRSFGLSGTEAKRLACEKLEEVGLDASFAKRRPSEVSGGQCQRAAIARALMPGPSVLVCDEATSSLDVVAQAHIVSLLQKLKQDMALVFISHDLALVSQISDQLVVLNQGSVAEQGETACILEHPESDYAKLLLSSAYTV